jgi:hypothetical protein
VQLQVQAALEPGQGQARDKRKMRGPQMNRRYVPCVVLKLVDRQNVS